MGFIAPLIASVALHPIAAAAIGGAAFFGAKTLLGGLTGGSSSLPAPAALPATPSFEEAQATSLEEQRDILRRKSRTDFTTTNLLATASESEQKTLLGA